MKTTSDILLKRVTTEADMTSPTLLEQTITELQDLPEPIVREVLDFIGFLRQRYITPDSEQEPLANRWHILREIAGNWEDERDASEIIDAIYTSRTSSEMDKTL